MGLIKTACCFLFFLAILQYSYVSAAAPAPAPAADAPAPSSLTNYCMAKCQERCRPLFLLAVQRRLCEEVCTKCCLSTKCVPPGPIGFYAGRCRNWTFTLYRGIPSKCP